MRRFYAAASSGPVAGGHAVFLDGRPVRTPAQAELVVPSPALAAAIAAEWDAQPDPIRPTEMHLTQIANTALDRVQLLRPDVLRTLLAYAETDLVCHRADSPQELVARQRAHWDPLLDWLERHHGARLTATAGILPADQPSEAKAALMGSMIGRDEHALATLHAAAGALGSIVIALALVDGAIDADAAFDASQLDETFQMERWGEDAEAAVRRAALRHEVAAIARYAALLTDV